MTRNQMRLAAGVCFAAALTLASWLIGGCGGDNTTNMFAGEPPNRGARTVVPFDTNPPTDQPDASPPERTDAASVQGTDTATPEISRCPATTVERPCPAAHRSRCYSVDNQPVIGCHPVDSPNNTCEESC